MIPYTYKISPLQAVVLLHHLVNSDDAENDADRTVGEMVAELDGNNGFLSKAVLESALYCCNMEDERGRFWHPLNHNFDRFTAGIIPKSLHFDKYYNVIYEVKKDGQKKKAN